MEGWDGVEKLSVTLKAKHPGFLSFPFPTPTNNLTHSLPHFFSFTFSSSPSNV